MYKFEMPEFTVNYDIHKKNPYDKLSEGMRKVIDFQLENSKDAFDTNCTWDELRAKYIEERKFWNEGGPQPHKVVNMEVEGPIGAVPVRIYYPDDKPNHNALVFIHGGGFTVGSIDTHDRMMRCVMEAAGCVVIGVDYHLAPEAKFPIQLYESAAVVRYFHENAEKYNISPDNMAIGGDSGGANLALGVNLYLRDVFGGNDYIAALLLYYGAFGLKDGWSYRVHGSELDGMRKCDLDAYSGFYMEPGSGDEDNPYYATLNADLSYGMPATYMCCGDLDPLLTDSEALNYILKQNGVRTEFEVIPGVLHAYMHYGRMMDEAIHCLNASGAFYASVLNEK